VGRPSKRTPDREARLLEALRAGNTRSAACHYAGIDQGTLANWLARYSDFSDAINKAEADAEVRMVAQIARAAHDGTWTAAAWWLERRRPDDYGRRDRVEITLRQQAERLAAERGLDPEELIAEAERIVAGSR
jgi:transposase